MKPYNQKTTGKVVRGSGNTVSTENTLDRGKSVALDVGSKNNSKNFKNKININRELVIVRDHVSFSSDYIKILGLC